MAGLRRDMEGLRPRNEPIVEEDDGTLASPLDKDWDGDSNIQEDLWELDYMFGLE